MPKGQQYKTKLTPGTWEAVADYYGNYTLSKSSDKWHFHGLDPESEEAKANAVAIGHTPELIENCISLLKNMEWTYDGKGGWLIPAGSDGFIGRIQTIVKRVCKG